MNSGLNFCDFIGSGWGIVARTYLVVIEIIWDFVPAFENISMVLHTFFLRVATKTFVIGDISQLRLIAWNRNSHYEISGEGALDLYE